MNLIRNVWTRKRKPSLDGVQYAFDTDILDFGKENDAKFIKIDQMMSNGEISRENADGSLAGYILKGVK
jgi:hypothetical protein